MEKRKQRKLEAKGWRVGSAAEFLGLSSEEAALVEMKLRLSQALRARRQALHLSQVAVAKRLGSRFFTVKAASRLSPRNCSMGLLDTKTLHVRKVMTGGQITHHTCPPR